MKQNSDLGCAFRMGRSFALCAALVLVVACGKSDAAKGGGPGAGGSGGGGTPVTLTKNMVTGVDGSTVTTSLPLLPGLSNVVGTVSEDSIGIDFDPVDGAKDYRVYVLPNDADITAYTDGTLTVQNAIYRCAGMRQTFDLKNNLNASDPALTQANDYAVTAQIDANDANNTLGYVYVTAGAGRSPVYSLAVYPLRDTDIGWLESRPKIYTTSTATRDQLLSMGARDDGIAFYVPSAAGGNTQTVYSSQVAMPVGGQDWTHYEQYYFLSADMSMHSGDSTPPASAFEVLTAADGADSKPLMKVFYSGTESHDELVAGAARFHQAAYQGAGPLWHLEWAGITAQSTLVIEALENGCPYQGFLAPQHLALQGRDPFLTIDDLKAASSTGEVFVNGQYDGITDKPKPLARSFITVSPMAHDPSAWDFYAGFGSDLGTLTSVSGCTIQNCARWQSNDFDISTYLIEQDSGGTPILAFGTLMGQLWEAFDDVASDTTGKVRFTAKTKANIDADPSVYLHATMSVDIVSTDRRYPQLIISDQDAPVQEGFTNPNNNSVLLQPIQGPSMRLELQAFHGLVAGLVGSWDVNNQAPEHRFIDYDNQALEAQPSDSPWSHAGMDRMTKFDLFLSSQRAYVFMDNEPAGCTLLPSGVTLSGAVTVTIGDVLYHEGAPDELVCAQARPYDFMHVHQCTETKRHFDDVAFKSGSAPPAWDETKFPCKAY